MADEFKAQIGSGGFALAAIEKALAAGVSSRTASRMLTVERAIERGSGMFENFNFKVAAIAAAVGALAIYFLTH